MKTPTRIEHGTDAGYPTLEEFNCGRRSFLKKIAVGALSLGVGTTMVSACSDAFRGNAAPPDDTGYIPPDTRSDTEAPDVFEETNIPRVDTWQNEVDIQPETTVEEEDIPMPGGMPEPDYYNVRLPSTGFTQAYLSYGDYLSFAVSFVTYDAALAAYCRDAQGDGIDAITPLLSEATCESIEHGETLVALQDSIKVALEQHFQDEFGGHGRIESLNLVVDFCEYWGEIDGDAPAPDYP